MYRPALTQKDLAVMEAAGLSEDDFKDEPVDVWPENQSAYFTFAAMQTQWRVGMAGATGLDYAALPVALRMQAIPRPEWQPVMADIPIMEVAALAAMAERGD